MSETDRNRLFAKLSLSEWKLYVELFGVDAVPHFAGGDLKRDDVMILAVEMKASTATEMT